MRLSLESLQAYETRGSLKESLPAPGHESWECAQNPRIHSSREGVDVTDLLQNFGVLHE
jgi:hypothetical protein